VFGEDELQAAKKNASPMLSVACRDLVIWKDPLSYFSCIRNAADAADTASVVELQPLETPLS